MWNWTRTVVYKVMRPSSPKDRISRDQFRNEARITASLRHPGIVPIFGVVEDGSNLPAYAMELIESPNLTAAILEYRTLPAGEVRRDRLRKLLRHFVDVCRITAYAHNKDVVHGDIKPLNILADVNFGATWLIDWGHARLVGDYILERPVLPGTIEFRGPSVYDGSPATFASDVHALGLTLALILSDSPKQPASDVPRALRAIAEKAMHLDRPGRYASANALADDVENALGDRPVSAYRDRRATRIRRWFGKNRICHSVVRKGGKGQGKLALLAVTVVTAAALISALRANCFEIR